jgi:hypothetical protein
MYVKNFVVSIKCGDKFLRDNGGDVELPFNSEYSLFLKNLDSRDSVVGIKIDGEDVLDDNRIVVRGNSSVELLGFMEGSKVKRKFKFIEYDSALEKKIEYSPEFSLISVEVTYRKPKPTVQEYVFKPSWEWRYYDWNWVHNPRWNDPNYVNPIVTCCGDRIYGNNIVWIGETISSNGTSSYRNVNVQAYNCSSLSTNDVGITVKGDECNQSFTSTYIDDLEDQSHVITLRLKGFHSDNTKVANVVTNKDKIYCSECGKSNSIKNKYCPDCGNLLK